jgi:hypothetical protein
MGIFRAGGSPNASVDAHAAYRCSDVGGGLLIMQDPCAFTFKLGKPDLNSVLVDIKQNFDQHIANCRLEPDDCLTVVTGCTLTGDYHAALIKPQDHNAGLSASGETKILLFGARNLSLFHHESQLVFQTHGHRHVAISTDCGALGCSDNKNQCIFLNILRIKRKKRSQGFKVRAAAEPEDLDEHDLDDFNHSCPSTSGMVIDNTDIEGDGFEFADEYGGGAEEVGVVYFEISMLTHFTNQDTWNVIFDWLLAVSEVLFSNLFAF